MRGAVHVAFEEGTQAQWLQRLDHLQRHAGRGLRRARLRHRERGPHSYVRCDDKRSRLLLARQQRGRARIRLDHKQPHSSSGLGRAVLLGRAREHGLAFRTDRPSFPQRSQTVRGGTWTLLNRR
jgi:hypothetical protein